MKSKKRRWSSSTGASPRPGFVRVGFRVAAVDCLGVAVLFLLVAVVVVEEAGLLVLVRRWREE